VAKFKSITVGERFGKLTALEPCRTSNLKCKCQCDCGTTKDVKGFSLRAGTSQSCGCLKLDIFRAFATKHGYGGKHKSGTYSSWANMITRCTYEKHGSYPNYGGRGIKVCERWLKFENFLKDMGPRPPGHSIDRIDSNSGYEPVNCRWATTKEQARNVRTNKLLTFNAETLCLAEWAEKLGISEDVIGSRISNGWTVERALSTPVKKKKVA
jgi:hypothetical protein